jgi:hypothetical protein
LTQLLYFPIRIEESHVNRAVRIPLDIEFDDLYLRIVRPQEGTKAFQHDLVIVDERDTNGLGHANTMFPITGR